MINDDLDDLEVAQTTGTVHCMAWCSTSNCLWVVHYNADGTRMLASRHDVHARAGETRGEQAEPELYYQGYQLDWETWKNGNTLSSQRKVREF